MAPQWGQLYRFSSEINLPPFSRYVASSFNLEIRSEESMNPKMFIGSSSEAHVIAEKMQALLDRHAEVTLWSQGVFGLNESGLESLFRALDDFDYACFILAKDDTTITRGEERATVRDNVILEIGLFLGKLGKNRVFIVYPRGEKPSLPSDLDGITFLDFSNDRSDNNLHAALSPCCVKIKELIKEHGSFRKAEPQVVHMKRELRVEETLSRGSTKRIDLIVDSALYIADQKYKYKDELRTKVLSRQPIPTKYLYYTEEGCRHWLDICHKPEYKFYSHSVNHLSNSIENVILCATKNTNQTAFDFISLGSGNGEKDNIILKEMQKHLGEGERTFFYPIDISDPMIVEAIRNALGSGVDRNKLDVKAIVGDITILEPLSSIYEERPNKNLFSILGNTIGNNDEKAMMESIRDAMFEGDLVLIEINVDQREVSTGTLSGSFYKDDLNMTHDFVPLASLGVKFDRKLMEYRNMKGGDSNSVVEGTITTMAYYKTARISGTDINNIKLSSVHHYKLEHFIAEMEKRLKVKTLYSSKEDGVGLILAQRQAT